jgi:hypothetical protein
MACQHKSRAEELVVENRDCYPDLDLAADASLTFRYGADAPDADYLK